MIKKWPRCQHSFVSILVPKCRFQSLFWFDCWVLPPSHRLRIWFHWTNSSSLYSSTFVFSSASYQSWDSIRSLAMVGLIKISVKITHVLTLVYSSDPTIGTGFQFRVKFSPWSSCLSPNHRWLRGSKLIKSLSNVASILLSESSPGLCPADPNVGKSQRP